MAATTQSLIMIVVVHALQPETVGVALATPMQTTTGAMAGRRATTSVLWLLRGRAVEAVFHLFVQPGDS